MIGETQKKEKEKKQKMTVNKLQLFMIDLFRNGEATKHTNDRSGRINEYNKMGLLAGRFVSCFKVDKGHANGKELHAINESGLLFIYNFKSRKLITILHPRPQQIKRYYQATNSNENEITHILKDLIKRNKMHNLNQI
jgi:hypothetical protein